MRSWTILESALQKVTAHRKRLSAGKRLVAGDLSCQSYSQTAGAGEIKRSLVPGGT